MLSTTYINKSRSIILISGANADSSERTNIRILVSALPYTVDIGYSDILDIVILLSLGMNPRLHETHT